MIKKILLSLGLLTIGLINFGYCDEVGPWNGIGVPGQTFTSARRDTVDLYVSDNLNFSGTFDGITKDIFIVYARQFFYWNTRGEMSAYSANRNDLRTIQRGGKLTYYYKCDSFNVPFSGFTNCTQFNYTGNEIQNVNNLLGRRNVNDDIVYGSATVGSTVNDRAYSPFIGFNIPNENISIVFYFKCSNESTIGYGLPYVYQGAYGIDDEYSGEYNSRNRPNTYAGPSPVILGGGAIDEIPENGFPNTNRGVFDSYAEQGYVLSRCYSDFSLDNLATATGGIDQFYETELDDGVYYTGATVLDLFVEYGYGNSFESFFDYWYQTYNQSLINNSPAKYVGLSKGLWNMSNKYYYAGLSNKYVDYTKFYNYCSYFVNFDGDWDAEYTGPQLPNDVVNQLAPSQSAIDYLSGFIHSQNSGNNQNFDADTFFTSLTTKFDRLLNNINGSFVGIIPGYILAIMMALIFIRIISH